MKPLFGRSAIIAAALLFGLLAFSGQTFGSRNPSFLIFNQPKQESQG